MKNDILVIFIIALQKRIENFPEIYERQTLLKTLVSIYRHILFLLFFELERKETMGLVIGVKCKFGNNSQNAHFMRFDFKSQRVQDVTWLSHFNSSHVVVYSSTRHI